jgi:hypothetical protein
MQWYVHRWDLVLEMCQQRMDKVSRDKSNHIEKKVPANTACASNQEK